MGAGLFRMLSMAVLAGCAVFSLALCTTAFAAAPAPSATIAPLADGDEPIVVTEHVINTVHGPLHYEARAGRLALRDAETGEVRAHIFSSPMSPRTGTVQNGP